ncbi:unnamed protein product, partial [Didymodactylos carnosus]
IDITEPVSNTQVNPEQLGGGFEGDILLPPLTKGTGKLGASSRWPDGIVPYDMSKITDPKDQQMIKDAMQKLVWEVATVESGKDTRKACVYFRPREANDKTYLIVEYGQGCSAHVGNFVGTHTLTLQKQVPGKGHCFIQGIIMHELLHVLGFWHEQSRHDRDDYLTINHENIGDNMVGLLNIREQRCS